MNESFSFKGYRAATREWPYWPKARQQDSETMNNLTFEGEPVSGLCSNNWKKRQLKNESCLESLFNVLASRLLKNNLCQILVLLYCLNYHYDLSK